MKKKETKKISIDCPVDVLERIDRIAEFADLPRQKLITNLLDAGVGAMEDCKKIGVLHFALLMRDLEENMKKWAKGIREKKTLNGFEINH